PDLHEPNLLILLNDVARLIRTQADRRARAHGMTRAQWMILVRLRRCGGMTQRELAEILEVEPITVGRLVDRLAARQLVERRADPTADETATTVDAPPKRRRWLRPALMLGGVLAVAAGAGAFWLHGGRYAGTDDAYVQADKLLLSTDVSGIVRSIAVHEGDVV